MMERLHHFGEVQGEYSNFPMDLATSPFLPDELQEGDDITLGEGELVLLLSFVIKQGDTPRAAAHTHVKNKNNSFAMNLMAMCSPVNSENVVRVGVLCLT